jgi:hypothetical protein
MTEPTAPRDLRVEEDGKDLFLIIDGVKIAKRGRPGTRRAKTWISLKPGWAVFDYVYPNECRGIVVWYKDTPLGGLVIDGERA